MKKVNKTESKINTKARVASYRELVETGSGLQVCKNGYSFNFNLFQYAKMSRKTRLYDSGTLYHVILRGNGGQRIFSVTATLVAFISL